MSATTAHQEVEPGHSPRWASVHPALPYVLPFAVFFGLLLSADYLHPILGAWESPFRVTVLALVLWIFSRDVIDLRIRRVLGSLLMGIAVFAIWIGPDLLIPGYRQHWLFQNQLMGTLKSSIPEDIRQNAMVLIFRAIRAVLLVPIIEELFWRAWLLRWLVSPNFQSVPLGTYSASAMWISAILFASEHGPYWEVGLIAGLLYNYWMFKTRSLGDCIFAHAVTNGILSLFVVTTGRWEYWL
ncbi:MAG TPA: CAAX prenyl protease-related protein [Bryobacteraceae bacterium]|nr:CAAX prenyl protease-related protein [Bryobacteraceae bacterium]